MTKAKPKVSAKLVKKTITRRSKAKIKVTLKVAGVSKPTGKVVVYEGKKKLRTVTLKSKHKGKITVTLPRLKKGTHKLKVTYRGSSSIAKKTSKTVTLRVR